MRTNTCTALLAVALFAAPLSAQVAIKNERVNDRRSTGIPPGHLPPKGMCRVWIEGVAPGQQPAVTDCVTAERNRVANSRVIYGDRESFPGRGKGKFKRAAASGDVGRRCTVRDAVVVGDRVVNVCRDDKTARRRDGDDEDDVARALEKRQKKEAKALRKAEKRAAKEARKESRRSDGDRDD